MNQYTEHHASIDRRGNRSASARGAPRKRGSALVFSLMLVGIVTVTGMAMLQLHISRGRRQGQATDNKRAIYIAEAGIAEAYLAVAQGRSGNIASEAEPARFANGVFWVEAEDGDDGQVALRSTGLCRTGRFALSVVVERTFDPIASLGMFGGEEVIIGEGAVVDGYDSRVGQPQDLKTVLGSLLDVRGSARISSNGDVTVESGVSTPTTIHGNVQPGPGHAVIVEPGGTVTGSTLAGDSIVALPDLEMPVLSSAGDVSLSRESMTFPSGEVRYGNVSIPTGKSLTLTGPSTVVLDNLRLPTGSELIIDTTEGVVTLFVGTSLQVAPGAKITNSTLDPVNFVLLVGAQDPVDVDGDGVLDEPVVFSPSGQYAGFVYAPYTDLVIPSDLHLMGGVVGESLTLEPGSRLSFDAALRSTDITLSGLPRLVAWRIVALPDVEIVNLREDPLLSLKRDGITPTKSSDAALEGYVKMEYFDAHGDLQGYSGLATGVDWSDVKSVVRVMWDDDSFVGGEGQEWVRPSRVKSALLEDCR
ncbi:MAG: hypothetical protein H6831_05945 [Planctomycetes bacterium]|nr:hypothetical protein [Planctomycetota bacterium]MCB9903933.1 hypothetical protein [Planctomycetota bacterium]